MHTAQQTLQRRNVVQCAQINQQEAESQQIVATRRLYCLQYLVEIKSSVRDLFFSILWYHGEQRSTNIMST